MPTLCRQHGLDLQSMLLPATRCPANQVSALWDIALSHCDDPAIGLSAARSFKPVTFDAMGYAMMSSANLHDALQRGIRYSRIVGDVTTARLTPLVAGMRLDLHWNVGQVAAPRQQFEFTALLLLTFFRWMAGRPLRPLAVGLAHPVPLDRRPYDKAFGCPLVFDAPQYSFSFAHADLMAPLSTANAQLAELHSRYAEERLEQLDGGQTTSCVRKLMLQGLPDGEPTRASVAGALSMSPRTLQRRLQDEGTSFHQLLDVTRRNLAERYLASHAVALAEAACLLGFADQSTFTRAVKRWFKQPPQQMRAQLARRTGSSSPSRRTNL